METQVALTYAQYVNAKTIERFTTRKSVIFGQNIVAGSRISGLGASLDCLKNVTALNTPNAENSLMGFGLGMMLSGIDSAFLMKQHDFALLGLDQVTNTVNVAKNYPLTASFVVLMVIVDSGYEGPQASLNNLDEFASLSRSPVHFLNTRENIDRAFQSSRNPGFHMMALSQKSMKNPLEQGLDQFENIHAGQFFENPEPSSILLIYFGLELQYLNQIKDEFSRIGRAPDVLIVAKLYSKIHLLDLNLGKYSSIIVIDTSKSEISYAQKLASDLKSKFDKILYVGRTQSDAWGFVNSDEPETAPSGVLNMWKRSQKVE
jgi:hypothetical protein